MEDVRRRNKKISQRAKDACVMDEKIKFVKTEKVSDGFPVGRAVRAQKGAGR